LRYGEDFGTPQSTGLSPLLDGLGNGQDRRASEPLCRFDYHATNGTGSLPRGAKTVRLAADLLLAKVARPLLAVRSRREAIGRWRGRRTFRFFEAEMNDRLHALRAMEIYAGGVIYLSPKEREKKSITSSREGPASPRRRRPAPGMR